MSKIQNLLANLPPKALITSKYLREQGISRQLAQSYVDSGWLERLDSGIYKRRDTILSWQGSVYSLQNQLKLPIHVAGESALTIHDIYHHVTMNENLEPIFIQGPPKTTIPNWFKLLFFNRVRFRSTSFLPKGVGLRPETVSDGFEILVSRPERAILEVLMIVNNDHKFDDAANLLTSFRTWDGELLLSLLNACSSYKVRRLLFFLGEFHGIYPIERIVNKVDLGKGKIQVVPNGKYIAKYQITVPYNYSYNNEENPF